MKRVKLIGQAEDLSPSKRGPPCGLAGVGLFEKRILTNLLITDVIFADIPFSDLLNCSLVSKAWNLTCRGILVERFRTYFTLSEKSTVEGLQDFYNLLREVLPGHQQPVNGIRIKFKSRVRESPFSSQPFAYRMSMMMEELDVKFVSFDMSKLHLKATDFHEMFKALVQPHLGTLEFLEILNFKGVGIFNTLTKHLEVDSLPNLKELHFGKSQDRLPNWTFKRILRACPNLKTISAVMPYQLPNLIQAKNLRLASNVRFNYMTLTPNDLQLLQAYGLLIKHLDIIQHYKQVLNKYRGDFITRLQPLFTSHLQHNLKSLNIDLEPLVAILLQPSFPPLTNLKELLCRGGQRRFPCLFKKTEFQFAEVFPNLKAVTFCWSAGKSNWLRRKFGSQDYDAVPVSLYECGVPASLDSITTLKLYCTGKQGNLKLEPLTKIMDLDEAFPCVTYLDIQMDISGLEDLLKWICESWGDLLETLILREIKCLGFHNEGPPSLGYEWEDLQKTKRKPLSPGILYSDKLSQLQRLELEFRHPIERDFAGNFVDDERLKVESTFEPRAGHKVQLTLSGCRAAKRMKNVQPGVNIYDSMLGVHFCPRNLELSVMEEIVATKSICTNICKMLPTPDLLNCSRVNQSWNAVAREVLHHSRLCNLTLFPCRYYRKVLSGRLAWLVGGKQKLFNGIRISYSDIDRCGVGAGIQALAQLMEHSNPNHTKFKVLEAPKNDPEYPWFQVRPSHAPSWELVKTRMIEAFRPILKKLELDHVHNLVTSIELFDGLFRDVEGKLLVSNLKTIEFVDPEKLLAYPKVFCELLQELTSLERIEVPFCSELVPVLSAAGKAHCLKRMELPNSSEKVLLPLVEFAQENEIRIENLEIEASFQLQPKILPVFGKLLRLLCTRSHDSLRTLCLSLPCLHYLITQVSSTCPLVTVERVELLFCGVALDPQRLLTRIPFGKAVPSLEVVKVTRGCDPYASSSEYNPTAELDSSVLLQRCISVKCLELAVILGDEAGVSEAVLSALPASWELDYVAGVFPLVTKFSFTGVVSPFGRAGFDFMKILNPLWKTWPELKSVKIFTNRIAAATFESWILGITKEEWSTWEAQEGHIHRSSSASDLLSSMHYAPSSASFRSCKNLRELLFTGNIRTLLLATVSDNDEAGVWRRLCLN